MVTPKDVSVVVPAYNPGPLLREALLSVLEQKPLEVVLVDDGSQRPLPELPSSEVPIRVLRHDTNKGPGAARNTGVEACRGSWVSFLDADDKWGEGRLRLQTRLASEHNVQVVIGKTAYFGPVGGSDPLGREPRILPNMGSMIITKGVMQRLKLDERSNFAEDLEFLLRLKEEGIAIHQHDDVVFWYRQDSGMTAGRSAQEKKDDLMRVLRRSLARRRQAQGETR